MKFEIRNLFVIFLIYLHSKVVFENEEIATHDFSKIFTNHKETKKEFTLSLITFRCTLLEKKKNVFIDIIKLLN